jgi:hypothetical protein
MWRVSDCATGVFGEKWLMNSNRFLLSSLAALFALLLAPAARADSTVNQAFEVARGAVSPEVQTHVVSIYGTGAPDSIQKWYIIFYDPSIPSHGRAVLVSNGQIIKTYAANGGVVYRSDLTFDPSRMTPEGPALAAAQGYAAKHNISYDSVRALLKQSSGNRPFRWRIELMNANVSHGYVYINALDSSVASYAPPGSTETTSTDTTTTTEHHGNVESDANDFGTDVKRTFLGIGGDLQEFFTGERTVDKQ